MRLALPGSLLLHGALLCWGLFALPHAPEDEAGVEAVMVSMVSVETFSSEALTNAESSATQTLIAAGAMASEPVEEVEVTEVAELTRPVETPAAEPVESEDLASLPVLAAAPLEADPVQGLTPQIVSASADTVTAAAPKAEDAAPDKAMAVASIAPQVLQPVTEAPPPPKPLPRPEKKVAEAKPRPEQPKPRKPAPKQSKPKTPPSSGGNGGTAEANVAARAASGGKGQKGSEGNAAASKYPGLVQRALRRALRSPKGGGQGEVHVSFVVSASGAASGISISRSSGKPALDKEALATVKRANFPPIPPEAGRDSWSFTIPLAFTR